MKTICYFFLAIALSGSLVGCQNLKLPLGIEGFHLSEIKNVAFDNSDGSLSEVAPPSVIQQLTPSLAQYEPQVVITSPRPNVTVQNTTVEVNLEVENYPLFKDDRFGLGPHLNLILDNEAYIEIYDEDQPILLKNLKPGTHTVRVLAETPWHESFKNKGAFAQTTFNVLTQTAENNPDRDLPLLTYNQPHIAYSGEPIMLDFYLTNISGVDWQIKATIDGESFTIDQWQPVYLQGFKEGNNLVELELVDGKGQSIDNAFNQVIGLITYNSESSQKDSLAQLVNDEIPLAEARAIIQQNYAIEPVEEAIEPETITEESPSESKEVIVEPEVDTSTTDIAEKVIAQDSETETKKVISEPVLEISTPETPEKAIAKEIKIKIAPQAAVESQEVEIKITPSTIEEAPVNNTPVVTKTESFEDNQAQIIEETTVIPVEESPSVEITKTLIVPETAESNSITSENPQPGFKSPQWLSNMRSNLQKITSKIINSIKTASAS